MRTTSAVALARPAREQVDFHLLNADAEAQRVYIAATDRVLPVLNQQGLKWQFVRRRRTDHGYRPVVDVAEDIVKIYNAGGTEAELRVFSNYFDGIIRSCVTGCAVRPLPELDLTEQDLEGQENSLATERLVSEALGLKIPADRLLKEADVLEAEANVGMEKSRALRRKARQLQGSLACFAFPIVADSTSLAARSRDAQIAVISIGLLFTLFACWSALADRFGRHRKI